MRHAVDAQAEHESYAAHTEQCPGRAAAPGQDRQRGQRQRQDANVTDLDPRPESPVQLWPAAEKAGNGQTDPLRRRQGVADRFLIAPARPIQIRRKLQRWDQHRRGQQNRDACQHANVGNQSQHRRARRRHTPFEHQPEQTVQHDCHADEQTRLNMPGQRRNAQQQPTQRGPSQEAVISDQ